MSIKPVDYLACAHCSFNIIGKAEKRTQIGRIGRKLVLEITHIWIWLHSCHIEDEIVVIREVFET